MLKRLVDDAALRPSCRTFLPSECVREDRGGNKSQTAGTDFSRGFLSHQGLLGLDYSQ